MSETSLAGTSLVTEATTAGWLRAGANPEGTKDEGGVPLLRRGIASNFGYDHKAHIRFVLWSTDTTNARGHVLQIPIMQMQIRGQIDNTNNNT